MVRTLRIKLFRDLRAHWGQALAIGSVLGSGVATLVMSLSMLDSLTFTLDSYYQRNRFADVFVHMKRAPEGLSARIGEIPGVAQVQTRVIERITLDMPDLREPASGSIVSIPENPAEGLNVLYLRSGRYPEDTRSREVLVSQRFAESHGLRTGDTVAGVLNGRLEDLRIVGIALSPEFVYLIGPGGILPEQKRFGAFWMLREEMEAAFDMEGAFNDAAVSLTPWASEQEVIDRLDALTSRYGGLGAYGRQDQASHRFVRNEISELRGMTLIVPVIFFGVSAFLLNIVLSRLVATQREQIATLRAIGYSRWEIGRHYLGFVMLITAGGVLAGSMLGAWMGRGMTALYAEFFDFPSFQYLLRARVVVLAAAVSTLSAGLGVARTLQVAMGLPPAEAMRPLAPAAFRPTLLERAGLNQAVPITFRMILRQLERQPIRTGLSVFGVALATAILVVGSFSRDSINYLLDFQFDRVQRYDLDVVLSEPTDDTGLSTLWRLPGVRTIEPYRAISVRMRSGHVTRRVGVLGLPEPDGLSRLLDLSGRPVDLPEGGVVLSAVLGKILQVRTGDAVTFEVLEGRRPTFEIPVAALIDDFSGLAAYMRLDELNTRMREANTFSGAFVLVDPIHSERLYREIRRAPRVAAINVKSATEENFRRTISRNMGLMQPFLIGFSAVIAFGVVYNSARISLSERSRDLATLRVLGFSKREAASIQLGELVIVTGVALPLGLGLGYLLAWYTSAASGSELFRIPFVISSATFAFSAIVVVLASGVSGVVVWNTIRRINLIGVLKSRE